MDVVHFTSENVFSSIWSLK